MPTILRFLACPQITNGCFALPADFFGVNGTGCFFGFVGVMASPIRVDAFGCRTGGPNLRDNIAYRTKLRKKVKKCTGKNQIRL